MNGQINFLDYHIGNIQVIGISGYQNNSRVYEVKCSLCHSKWTVPQAFLSNAHSTNGTIRCLNPECYMGTERQAAREKSKAIDAALKRQAQRELAHQEMQRLEALMREG